MVWESLEWVRSAERIQLNRNILEMIRLSPIFLFKLNQISTKLTLSLIWIKVNLSVQQ